MNTLLRIFKTGVCENLFLLTALVGYHMLRIIGGPVEHWTLTDVQVRAHLAFVRARLVE